MASNKLIGWNDLDPNTDHSDLIGSFLHPSEPKENQPSCQSAEPGIRSKASHALQIVWSSLGSKFSYPMAYFLTNGVTARQLYQLLHDGLVAMGTENFRIAYMECDGAGR